MDREQYEKALRERQQEHLRKVRRGQNRNWQPCRHDGCTECHGTGVKLDGTQCVHMISCPCPKCTPYCMSVGEAVGELACLKVAVTDYAKHNSLSNAERFADTLIRHRREYAQDQLCEVGASNN